MSQARCPVCGDRFDPLESKTLPFCSETCRKIDLGRWIDERYSMPYERPDDDGEALPEEGD